MLSLDKLAFESLSEIKSGSDDIFFGICLFMVWLFDFKSSFFLSLVSAYLDF